MTGDTDEPNPAVDEPCHTGLAARVCGHCADHPTREATR
jgi:hypothetical protein